MNSKLYVSSSPHIHCNDSTSKIMLDVIISLIPAFIASAFIFGIRAIFLVLLTVASCVLSEYVSRKIMKRILKKIYGKTEEELTVNNTFRFMQGYKFIPNWEHWKLYYEKRNKTAHAYKLEKSRALIAIIPQFIEDTNILITNIERKLENDSWNNE